MTATTTMEERTAAALWTAELSQAGHEISQAARRLQTNFHVASEKAIIQKGGKPIPDPIKLLRRLAALESRVDQLRRDCLQVANEKKSLALAVTDIQLQNAHMLRKMSDTTEHAANDNNEAATPLEDNWVSLASAIEEQHELLSMSAQDSF